MGLYNLVKNRESQRSPCYTSSYLNVKIISQNIDKSDKSFSAKTCNYYTFGTGKRMIQFAKVTAIRVTEIE